MIFYKILALFLLSSPITISNSTTFFPYSFLGFVLFFIADCFTPKRYTPSISILFFIFISISILSTRPLSYHIMIQFFIIYQYIYFSITIPKINIIFYIGIIISMIGFFYPIVQLSSTLLLAITLLINTIISKKHNKIIYIKDENDDPILTQIIPEEIVEENQELNYVIPLSHPEDNNEILQTTIYKDTSSKNI